MKSKRVKLSWMDIIREGKKAKKSPTAIINDIWRYGISEEKRITKAFERKK